MTKYPTSLAVFFAWFYFQIFLDIHVGVSKSVDTASISLKTWKFAQNWSVLDTNDHYFSQISHTRSSHSDVMSVTVTIISISQTTSIQMFLVVVEIKLDHIESKCVNLFEK